MQKLIVIIMEKIKKIIITIMLKIIKILEVIKIFKNFILNIKINPNYFKQI